MVLSKSLELYDFQNEVKAQVMVELLAGRSPIATMATGGGKTELALSVAQNWPGTVHITAHRIELVEQPIFRAQGYGMDAAIAWRQSGSDYNAAAHLYANSHLKFERAFDGGLLGDAKGQLLIVDEAHHAYCATMPGEEGLVWWEKSPRLANFIRRWKQAGGLVLGLTATLWQLNPYHTFAPIWDVHIEGPQTSELVRAGRLVIPHVWSPRGALAAMRGQIPWTGSGDVDMSKVSDKARWSMVNIPIDEWHKPRLGQRLDEKQTLFFAQNGAVAVEQAKRLRDEGYSVGLLLHDIDKHIESERELAGIDTNRVSVNARFREATLQCVVNVGIVGEGSDFPAAEVVIIGFATKSITRLRQAVGRGLRTAPGKYRCFILDCAANTRDPEVGSVLTDLEMELGPRALRLKGQQILASCVNDLCDVMLHPRIEFCRLCGTPQGSVCEGCIEFRRNFWALAAYPVCERCHDEGVIAVEQSVTRSPGALAADIHSGANVWHKLNDNIGMTFDYSVILDAMKADKDALILRNDDELIELGEHLEVSAGDDSYMAQVIWVGANGQNRIAVAVQG